MKTKEQKKEAVEALASQLPGSTITIFTTFARAGEPGLSVAQMQEMKRALRAAEGEYLVAKKTLVEKALQQLKYLPAQAGDGIDLYDMDGSLGLVLTHGDAYAIAKTLYTFAKANPALKLFTAMMDGRVVSHEDLIEMATMPTRDELVARLLGMLQYPLKSLAIVLGQIEQSKATA